MRKALRIIFSRYGIVAIILLLVLGVIAIAQDRGDERPLGDTGIGTDSTTLDSPNSELTADDGIATFECEGEDCDDNGSPLHDPFEEPDLPSEAVARALEFTEAWLNTDGVNASTWYQGIAPYLTVERAELMQGVNPIEVPAERITGEETVDGSEVSIPLDTGTLTLTMIEDGNDWVERAWLVSAIDWEQA